MDLYAETELQTFAAEPVVAVTKNFAVIRYGWFSYAFVLGEEDKHLPDHMVLASALRFVDAMRMLES